MGRPLGKKYFGNFNIGTNGYTPAPGGNTGGDDGIGGEGIANFAVTAPGNYINRLPTIATFGAPAIPGGVQAAGVVHSVAQSASPAADGINYWVGDIITDANGSTWRVTELEVYTATLDPSHQGTGYGGNDTIPYAYGININLDGVNGSGVPSGAYNFTEGGASRGSWTTTGAAPAATGAQSPSGLGGHGAQWNLVWRIKTLAQPPGTPVDYAYGTTYLYGASNVTTDGHGTGAALNVGFSPDHLAVTQKGSGYIGTETIVFTSTSGGAEVTATGTLVRTTDSGSRQAGTNLNVASNQDNAIIIHANTTGAGTKIGDIQKQTGSHRYKTRTADGVAVCKLVKTDSPAVKQAYITATDQSGAHYWVTKLTSRRAVIWPKGDGTPQYPLINGTEPHRVGWTFGDAVAPGNPNHQLGLVKIENA